MESPSEPTNAVREREYERRMTCPRCGQYGDGCNCDAALRYQEAVERWALCIHLDNGLQGITMGHVFALAEAVPRNATEIVGDLRMAQAKLEEAEPNA